MPFEEFTAKTRPNINIPMVSILKQGRIGLNTECYKKYFLNYKFAVFFYDKQNKKIGIRPTNQFLGNAFNIKLSKNGKIASISAASFLKHYTIPCNKSRSYPCHWNENEDILEVQL